MIRTLALVLAGMMTLPAVTHAADLYEVYGVEEHDMLKMRSGPGTGFTVIVGLPNGTQLRVHSCERTGAHVWCRASLAQAGRLKGYVSQAYIRQK
mgnify:CR=1 FL=1